MIRPCIKQTICCGSKGNMVGRNDIHSSLLGHGIYKNAESGEECDLQRYITNEVLCTGLPRVSTAITERCLRFSGHCWKSENEVVSDLVLWGPKHGKRCVGGQAPTFVDLLEAGLAGEGEPLGSTEVDLVVVV